VRVYTVSQVNDHIKRLLEADESLRAVFVRGEISNYKMAYSGHHYFSLKDEGGVLKCAFFKGRAASGLRFRPANGMKVVAFGYVGAYPQSGEYQLYVEALKPEGAGDLQAAFEALKAKLAAQGLFDREHKKPLPRYPARIALVTSPTGAAVRDMLRVLGARWPMAQVSVIPTLVQGAEAPGQIAQAIRWVNERDLADLIITGRGGGSMEDLWCFNDEEVARAIYASHIPVISAVGHEPDVTIADYVADLRAATPSNGAELAVPDQNDQYALLQHLGQRMAKAMDRRLKEARLALDRAGRSRMLQNPMTWVDDRRMGLEHRRERLCHSLTSALGSDRERFARLAASLDALSPLKVLSRGYAIAQGERGVIRSVEDTRPGDRLTLRVADGTIPCVTVGEPAINETGSDPAETESRS